MRNRLASPYVAPGGAAFKSLMSSSGWRHWLNYFAPAGAGAILAACVTFATGFTASAQDAKPVPEGESFFFTPPGFEKEGQPVTADATTTGQLKIVVLDSATGRPTRCRIAVVGPDGNYYQPPENHLTKYAITGVWPVDKAWGNRPEKAPWRYLGRYFYSTGEVTVSVPAGKVRVEVAKGFEFTPQAATAKIETGKSSDLKLTLTRTAAMAPHGYFGGDTHLHFARATEQDDETILDLLEAEDVWYGTPLGYNEPAGPYSGIMDTMASPQFRKLGRPSIKSRGTYSMLSGQEYRSGTFGHLNLYLRDRLVFEGKSFHTDDGPAYGIVGADTQADGGVAIHAHGGYAQEIYADAALGTVNAVELLQFGVYRGIGLADWYHILNTGYRFPAEGASDFPACRFMSDCRTYVWDDPAKSTAKTGKGAVEKEKSGPEIGDWIKGVAAGRSFMTTGPLLLFEVDGLRPGSALKFDGAGPRTVKTRVRVRSEVTPVTNIDLIVNGQVVKRVTGKHQGDWWELEQPIELKASSWIAARAWSTTPGGQPDAEAHSNPVYVSLNGKAPYSQASLDAWVEQIDKQIAIHTKRNFAGKAPVLAYFQRARDVLLKIRQRGGLKADENPANLMVQASRLPAAGASSAPQNDLAADGSQRDPTDDEMREFLKPVPGKSPAEALRTFETLSGFHLELVAAEPLVRSPVASAIDADGNLYVCEMRDYPFKPADGGKPVGGVRLLRDVDGDGRYDEAHDFAEELLWAAGVVPWKGGVFIAAPPDIWYMKDTDGDFKADVKRRVFTGFGLENQQAMVNNLQFGLDHKIYGSTAGNGGEIRPGNDPHAKPFVVNGRDFRFDPATERFETITGTVQFGNTFDDWGSRFLCSESQPLRHVVLEEEYLVRNPFLAVAETIQNVAPGPVPIFRISPIERWRHIRSSRRIAKNERAAASAGASHHVVDAAAGVTIYRGGAYPAEYYGQVFFGDGQNNLVHRRHLVPDGVTFSSHRVDEKTEFVRSSDIWFRPVNFLNAPDGTLYCLDMNREYLESIHIPLDVVKHLDLASGRNNGRIYRIAPDGFRSPAPPRLSKATSAELVAALESPHGWWRDTAQRLIYERQDKSILPALRKMAGESASPQSRLGALWSLAGLHSLDEAVLFAALRDPQPGVRENAVKLSRVIGVDAALPEILPLVEDTLPRVRLEVAYALGDASPASPAAAGLARLARREGSDRWMRSAILSSASQLAPELFAELFRPQDAGAQAADKPPFFRTEAGAAIVSQLANLIGTRNDDAQVGRMLDLVATGPTADDPVADRLLLELVRGLKRRAGRLAYRGTNANVGGWLTKKQTQARQVAADSNADPTLRLVAIELVSSSPPDATRELFLGLIRADQPEAIQTAAVRALADDNNPTVTESLLAGYRAFTPDVRRAVLETLLQREDRTRVLLEAAAREEVSLSDVEPARRDLLLKHKDEAIRKLAEQVFAGAKAGERKEVLARYQAALTLQAKAESGQAIFEKNCATCHQLAGKGFAVGPNLASSPSRDGAVLLTHILDPSQYVLPNFVQYVVADKQGRSYTGMLSAQTATSVTLKKEKDETVTILRRDIDEIASTGKSLMPEGLEKNITVPEMASLIAYLKAAAATSTTGDPYAERDFGTIPGLIEPARKPAP